MLCSETNSHFTFGIFRLSHLAFSHLPPQHNIRQLLTRNVARRFFPVESILTIVTPRSHPYSLTRPFRASALPHLEIGTPLATDWSPTTRYIDTDCSNEEEPSHPLDGINRAL